MSNDTINVEHTLVKDSSQVPRNKSLKIFHQNIRGLGNKSTELYCHSHHDLPHILCLSEHHLSESKLQLIHLANYSIWANYCRKTFLKVGVTIFVHRNLKYNTINNDEYNIDKDIEACAIQLDSTFNKVRILTIYRSLRGNFTNFLNQLDLILQKLYSNKYNIVICSDVNVNYLIDNNRRSQLDAVLHSYNLAGIVKFPTRFGLNYHMPLTLFSLTSTFGKYDLYLLINGLTDCDAQLVILKKGHKREKECHTYVKRKINKYTIADFQLKLSHETWELVFDGTDVNKIFNSFLIIFLRIYYSSFPVIQAKNKMNQNLWITPGIITSCQHERELYRELQNNNHATLASYYRNYSKILSVVIRKAKIIEHDKLILNSHNKVKITWGIINKKIWKK
jgi:hypothetical protein